MDDTTLEDQVKELRGEVEELRSMVLPLVRQAHDDDDYYQRGIEALG